MDFKAAAHHLALEISALCGRGPSPLPRRLDYLLEDARGMRRTHRGREFELAKWRPEKFAQPASFEINPGNVFGSNRMEIEPLIVVDREERENVSQQDLRHAILPILVPS